MSKKHHTRLSFSRHVYKKEVFWELLPRFADQAELAKVAVLAGGRLKVTSRDFISFFCNFFLSLIQLILISCRRYLLLTFKKVKRKQ